MPTTLDAASLAANLKAKVTELGLKLTSDAPDSFTGEIESIKSKWWFGGRKAVYRMSFRLDSGQRTAAFREAVIEKSWGLPPPTVTVETETLSDWKRSGTRVDRSVGGGGSLDFARARTALEEATANAGWQFRPEGGRMP